MVLSIAEAFASKFFPTQYLVHISVGILSLYVLRVFSQGRRTDRERDLHARVVLVTGGFTPLGLTLLQNLAQRGAHVIALSQDPVDSPNVSILIDLLRTTTSNEEIYAEECDLASPSSIRTFCTKFLTGKDQRLDAIIFTHEHRHIGSPKLFSAHLVERDEKERQYNSLATFLITTLLLPVFLVAPVERDIRIINVVNPFYAAASGLPFDPALTLDDLQSLKKQSIFLREGKRSLRTIVLTRHLQRILNALPTGAQIPKTEQGSRTVPVVSDKLQKSNIVAVSVSPGISRLDTVSPFLNADYISPTRSFIGIILYMMLQPLLRIFTKSPFFGIQTILHAFFLPTPFKILQQTTVKSTSTGDKGKQADPVDFSTFPVAGEMLLPGALYAECAAVKLYVNITPEMREQDMEFRKEAAAKASKGKGKESSGKESSAAVETIDIPDDGEYGGELAGRMVWEAYEEALKVWEKENPGQPEEVKDSVPPQPKMPTVVEENPNVY